MGAGSGVGEADKTLGTDTIWLYGVTAETLDVLGG